MPLRKDQKQAYHRGSNPPLPSRKTIVLHDSWKQEEQPFAPTEKLNCQHRFIIGPEVKGHAEGVCELCGDKRMLITDHEKAKGLIVDHKRGMHSNLHRKPLVDKIVDSLLDAQASPEIEDGFYRRMRAGVYLRP